jgi:multidrug efflux pump subunit AcrA (membrane-fusion protein)
MFRAGSAQSRKTIYRRIAVTVGLIVLVPTIAWSLWPSGLGGPADDETLLHTVKRSRFVHEITERGNVESASNIEIRCEVQSKNSVGTTILEIIPEGTYVEKGTVVCRLDSSALENDRVKQQIVCSNSEAALIKATNDLENAKIAKEEYDKGTYKEAMLQIEAEMSTAEENKRRAVDYLAYSQRLFDRGYVTKLQLEGDEFAVKKADIDYQVADKKREVLEKYTREKMLNQLDSAIATADAAKRAAERTHQLDLDQLALVESQVEKCIIKAPEPGQVVYANETGNRGTKDIIIQEGEMVRERQVIIRLPDPKRMQVKAKINEARVSLVTEGMSAAIRMDAYPDLELGGEVSKVNEYPAPTSWFNPNVKEYETVVRIAQSPPGMKPGLTAEVRILIERIDDAIHVPVQCVFEHGGKHYAAVRSGSQWQARPVELGASSDKSVVVRQGLDEGESVALNAAALREQLDLPALSHESGRAGGPRPSAAKNGAAKPPGAEPEKAAGGERRGPPGGGREGGDANPAAFAERLFSQYDSDHDGRIELQAMPETLRERFKAADANGDGRLDRAEFNAAAQRLMRRNGEGRPTDEPRPQGEGRPPGGGRPRGPAP